MAAHCETQSVVYKILPRSDWEGAVKTGSFAGSADDVRDGFVHLSAAAQLAGTAAKYFKGQGDLLLVAFQAESLGPALKWEPSRGGELFPHLFSALPADKATAIHNLALGEDGVPTIPEGLV